jgi:hypothetical protein
MNQNIWGPHLWFSLHTISFNYPANPTIEDKKNYNFFFTSLKEVIPCSICKKNYIRHLIEHPIDNYLNSKEELVKWVIDMHNMVNTETGKKNYSYNTIIKMYEDVYKKKLINKNYEDYENLTAIPNKNTSIENKPNNLNKIFYILFIIFFIIFIIFLYLSKKI